MMPKYQGWQLDDFRERILKAKAGDSQAEGILRGMVVSAGNWAPLDALLEICETLVRIRQRDYKDEAGGN